ncbi:MAG: SDR family NAD(P)-dependent oxidoreductase [Acidovorax sp.]|nr:SDR family NAD(P)-dependent oxidoreductase [Acidovorax sp.]
MSSLGTLLIAGHAAGFGDALESRFKAGGYTVVSVARSAGTHWATDLRDPQATERLFEALDRNAPPLAGVVHNAMQFHRAPFLQTSAQTLQDVWQSMVLTAFNVSRQAIPRMQAARPRLPDLQRRLGQPTGRAGILGLQFCQVRASRAQPGAGTRACGRRHSCSACCHRRPDPQPAHRTAL